MSNSVKSGRFELRLIVGVTDDEREESDTACVALYEDGERISITRNPSETNMTRREALDWLFRDKDQLGLSMWEREQVRVLFDKLIYEQWADQQIGTMMRAQRSGTRAEVLSWELAKRGKGVWFNLKNGRRVYRKYPRALMY